MIIISNLNNKFYIIKKRFFGEFEFDFGTKILKRNKENINLTSSELLIIEFLSSHCSQAVSSQDLEYMAKEES